MRYIVTGANRGIGLEFVKQLVERGDEVFATARRPDAAEALNALAAESDGLVRVLQLDVADEESLSAFLDEVGDTPIDALINNAGIYPRAGGLGELDYEEMRRGFEVNTIAPLRLAEALLPNVRAGEGKRIMCLTSQMGSIDDNGSGGSYAYRMSKTALNMGVRSLAIDVRGEGIAAFVIHPGWVQTDMGGPNAKITTEQSVSGMLAVLDSADTAIGGHFMNWDGAELPW